MLLSCLCYLGKGLFNVRRWFIVVALFFSHMLWASSFPLVIHHQADTIYSEEKTLQRYSLALGIYKKIDNRWQPEESLRLKAGKLTRYTLTLDENYSAEEVFAFYHQQLPAQQVSTLFTCEGRDCGSSNVWANNHFKIRQLYGLDQFQFYGVYQWQSESTSPVHYITLYAVRRGNGRIYTQIDIFSPDNQ